MSDKGVWGFAASHNTYPGFAREICAHYGLVKDTSQRNSPECLIAAEKYFTGARKRISDRCEKDSFGLLKHESLRAFFDAAWLVKRYAVRDETPTKPITPEGNNMTVSLYKSSASGSEEIVVQTNAQSLEVFVASFSDALAEAITSDSKAARALICSALKNAFPIAFALSGYKADKVSEARLLTCGYASPDSSELVAQSRV